MYLKISSFAYHDAIQVGLSAFLKLIGPFIKLFILYKAHNAAMLCHFFIQISYKYESFVFL